jgi:hypothetical protein
MSRAQTQLAPMVLYNIGDRVDEFCETCARDVVGICQLGSVELEVTGTVVDDVLVVVCPHCDETLSVPAQSEPRLKLGREFAALAKIPARLTQSALDALGVIADRLHTSESLLRSRLFTYYLHRVVADRRVVARLTRRSDGALLRGTKPRRIEVRVRASLFEAAWPRVQRAGITTKGDLVAGIIALALDDLSGRGDQRRAADLQAIAESI